MKGPRLIVANAFLNWIAAALAGASNVAVMRSKEIIDGIEVENEEGTVKYGKSKEAGKKAVMETGISRFILPLPVLFFPACANFALEKARLMPKNANARKILELTLCICSLSFALPMSIALFKQRTYIDRANIDEELKNLKSESYKPENFGIEKEGDDKTQPELVERFYFNKGL